MIDELESLYRPTGRTLVRDLLMLDHAGGAVFSGFDCLLAGRSVPLWASADQMSDLTHTWGDVEMEGWYVWIAIGDLTTLLKTIPWGTHKWLAFSRQGRIRWRNLARLARLAEIQPNRTMKNP